MLAFEILCRHIFFHNLKYLKYLDKNVFLVILKAKYQMSNAKEYYELNFYDIFDIFEILGAKRQI